MFPGVSIILVAEDDQLANYRRPQALSDFRKNAVCKVIPSSKITAN